MMRFPFFICVFGQQIKKTHCLHGWLSMAQLCREKPARTRMQMAAIQCFIFLDLIA